MTKQVDKCWKGFKHLWSKEPVKVTKTHKLKKCQRCRGTIWLVRTN